jgi:cytochrome b
MSEKIASKASKTAEKVYVWDVPTRLFHWSLVIAVTTSLASAELGYMTVHILSGHVVLALVLFRVVWGLIGGRHARFASFIKGPVQVLRYARRLLAGETPSHLGHNPMGGWSVAAVIGLLALQAGTGLFANDDILTEGPLVPLISKSTSNFLTLIHDLSSKGLYTLIALHLAAVAFYTIKGHPIIVAMITGEVSGIDRDAQDKPSGVNVRGSSLVAIVVILIAAAIAYAIKTY